MPVALTALCTPRIVETYFRGMILGTMITNKTTRGPARQSVEVRDLRGENPTPPAKEIIPGRGFLQVPMVVVLPAMHDGTWLEEKEI